MVDWVVMWLYFNGRLRVLDKSWSGFGIHLLMMSFLFWKEEMSVEGNGKNRELQGVENVGGIDGKSIKRAEEEMPALGIKLLEKKDRSDLI